MAVVLAYDGVLSRVRVTATGLSTADTAIVDRSTDGLAWTTVRGGAAVSVTAGAIAIPVDDYEFVDGVPDTYRVRGLASGVVINTQTAQITPTLGAIWLKDIGRPFLNRPIAVVMPDDNPVSRAARDGVFNVVGRSAPIAVTDVRGSRTWNVLVQTATIADATVLDLVLSTGDTMLIHVPSGCQVHGGYVRIGNTTQTWHPLRPEQCLFTLPVTEAAAPGPYVVGSTATWGTVLATYGTWSAVVAANPTWSALLNLIGAPTEVIVP